MRIWPKTSSMVRTSLLMSWYSTGIFRLSSLATSPLVSPATITRSGLSAVIASTFGSNASTFVGKFAAASGKSACLSTAASDCSRADRVDDLGRARRERDDALGRLRDRERLAVAALDRDREGRGRRDALDRRGVVLEAAGLAPLLAVAAARRSEEQHAGRRQHHENTYLASCSRSLLMAPSERLCRQYESPCLRGRGSCDPRIRVPRALFLEGLRWRQGRSTWLPPSLRGLQLRDSAGISPASPRPYRSIFSCAGSIGDAPSLGQGGRSTSRAIR